MKLASMAKPAETPDEIVRTNLKRFREEAGLSQADAADISGVSIDNLRRYESGTTAAVPGTVLSALAPAYGHSVDDFFKQHPPAAKLNEAPVFFLRLRPDVTYDQVLYKKLQDAVDKANAEASAAKRPKKS